MNFSRTLLAGLLFLISGADSLWAQFKQTGYASYYHDRFTGRRTTNGERYDPNKFTAAHRTLPFGTLLRVTVVKTGRTCVVRVNDRGPYAKSRILDLSKVAAKQLGIVGGGVAKVTIEVIPKDKIKSPADTSSGEPSIFTAITLNEMQDMNRKIVKHKGYSVQLFSADSYEKAYEYANTVSTQVILPLYIWMVTDGQKFYFRVLAGNYVKRTNAERALIKCRKVEKNAFVRKTM